MCRSDAACVAISYYGDDARADWIGKCYLSLGACTITETTAGGLILHRELMPQLFLMHSHFLSLGCVSNVWI